MIMKSLLCTAVLALAGCASGALTGVTETTLPRLGAGIQASEDLYTAACKPEPLPKLENVCPAAKDGINKAVEVYTEVNNAVKAAQ